MDRMSGGLVQFWRFGSTPSSRRQLSLADLAQVAERAVEIAHPYLAATDFDIDSEGASPLADVVLARWLESLVRKLQALCGIELAAGHIVATADPAVCRVAIRFEDEGLVRPALKIAHALLAAALDRQPYDFAAAAARAANAGPTASVWDPAPGRSSRPPAAGAFRSAG